MKKAVSPLIAAVMLIAFAVTLGATVMMWSRGFFNSQTGRVDERTASEVACNLDASLDWLVLNGESQVCHNITRIKVTVENIGSSNISGVKVNAIAFNGTPLSPPINYQTLTIGEAKNMVFYVGATNGFSTATAYPVVSVSGNYVVCTNKGISIEEVPVCG